MNIYSIVIAILISVGFFKVKYLSRNQVNISPGTPNISKLLSCACNLGKITRNHISILQGLSMNCLAPNL